MTTDTSAVPVEQESVPEKVHVDFFGFSETKRFHFPQDPDQWIDFKVMNEGDKARFQKLTQRDLILERKSGDARMKVDPAVERHELIKACVVDWNVYRGGKPYAFSVRALEDLLRLADPRLIEDLEKEIRKANPWLLGEMTVEDIDKEIANLQEMREVALERERGEASSASR